MQGRVAAQLPPVGSGGGAGRRARRPRAGPGGGPRRRPAGQRAGDQACGGRPRRRPSVRRAGGRPGGAPEVGLAGSRLGRTGQSSLFFASELRAERNGGGEGNGARVLGEPAVGRFVPSRRSPSHSIGLDGRDRSGADWAGFRPKRAKGARRGGLNWQPVRRLLGRGPRRERIALIRAERPFGPRAQSQFL